MGYLDNTVEYGFGQLGSGYLRDVGIFFPPSGLVIMAITIIDDAKFTKLVADNKTNVAYFGTQTGVTLNGSSNDQVNAADIFPKGLTIYGRFNEVQLNQGKVILYFGR
jgi:hypothetical protein